MQAGSKGLLTKINNHYIDLLHPCTTMKTMRFTGSSSYVATPDLSLAAKDEKH